MSKLTLMVFWFLILLAFSPTMATYFSQDDWVFLSHVYKQPIWSVFRNYPEAFYRPVGQQLFFFLGSWLFGLEAQGFHLLGFLIHLLNIWLLGRIMNIWNCDRRSKYISICGRSLKYFLLIFYAVNPVHFVALNWLTQIDLEIAVGFSLLAFLFWEKTILSPALFLLALLSHEIAVTLPLAIGILKGPALPRQGRALIKPIVLFAIGISVLAIKFWANPFSAEGDYRILWQPMTIISTVRWYLLRALAVPEGVRNLPPAVAILSFIPGLLMIGIFRQRILRGLGIYLLGVFPVLGFGGHLLAAYSVFGLALMVIELGRSERSSSSRSSRATAGSVAILRLPRRYAPRNDVLMIAVMSIILIVPSAIFVYSNVSKHWSTSRGAVSRELTKKYTMADSKEKREIMISSKDFENNPEIYFSSMMGKQFEVLDRGVGRGLFDVLFYRGNDLTTQFLPDAEFFADTIKKGKFPRWNPWIFGGMPYFLDPQNFLWYPPNYIFLLTPVESGFLILLAGHLALAGWMMKRLLGEFGVLGKFGLLGSMMFILAPKMVGHIEEGNWTLIVAASWLPALYWAVKKNKFWGIVISLTMIIINNLNIGYYSTLFVFSYLILKKSISDRLINSLISLMKIFLVVLLLTLPRWLPLAMFGGQTVRANLQEAPLPLWGYQKIAKSLTFPLAAGHPQLQNEEILYLGIAPLVIGILVVFGKLGRLGRIVKNRDLLFWLVWITFIFLVALNEKTILFHLIKWLPGFLLLRITTRAWMFAALAAALATPVMIREIGGVGRIKITWIAKLFLSIAILAEFGWFGWKIFSRRQIVSDSVPARFYRQMTTAGIPAFAELQRGKPVRAYCTTGCLNRLTAQRMGIALLGGNNPIQLKSFVEYLQAAGGYKETGYHPILPPYTVFNQKPQPNAQTLAQTATKFVVSPHELMDNNFKLIDQEGEYRLYFNSVKISEFKDHHFEL